MLQANGITFILVKVICQFEHNFEDRPEILILLHL